MLQGKLAELRSIKGTNKLATVKEVVRRAAVTPIRTITVSWKKRRYCILHTMSSDKFALLC